MVDIRTYKEYWANMVTRIPELKGSFLVAIETQLQKKISDVAEFPILVATVPSADPDSKDEDNTGETNSCLIFVLKAVAENDRDDANYVDDMELMQGIMKAIKDFMLDDKVNCDATYHELMSNLNEKSFHQDPEYNYLGCDGWSLSFKVGSVGY